MAFIPVTNVAQATLSFLILDSDIAENIFHIKNTGAWDASGLLALNNAMIAWEATTYTGASYKLSRADTTTFLTSTARDLTTQTSPVVTTDVSGGGEVGSDASGSLNNGLTKAFTARTGLSGRSQRGRTFVVGLPVDAVDSGDPNKIKSSAATGYSNFLTGLIAAIPAANAAWSLVVVSKYHNGAPRASGVATPITSYGYADLNMDFQRRRAPGHSRHH